MKTNLSLSIPQACSEKWENFTSTSDGGFCGSCNKVVIDFTKMSDDKVLSFFKNKSAHACGRFRPDQLKTYTDREPMRINPGLTLLKAGVLSLFFILISKQTDAQTAVTKPKTETVQPSRDAANGHDGLSEDRVVKGIVKSADDGSTLPGVNVLLKGTSEGTVTNENGEFEFPRKLGEGDVLVFTFIGLETMEIPVTKKWDGKVEVPMLCMSYDIMGKIAVSEPYTANRAGLRGLWTKFKDLF